MRNFNVEPLSTRAAVFLLQEKHDNLNAKVTDDQSFVVRIERHGDGMYPIISTLHKWGYEIVGVKDININKLGVEIHAMKSPNIVDQALSLLSIDIDIPIEVVLDGVLLGVHNRYADDEELISVEDWAAFRSESPETIEENLKRIKYVIDNHGGIPGTQSYVEENGGVPVETL